MIQIHAEVELAWSMCSGKGKARNQAAAGSFEKHAPFTFLPSSWSELNELLLQYCRTIRKEIWKPKLSMARGTYQHLQRVSDPLVRHVEEKRREENAENWLSLEGRAKHKSKTVKEVGEPGSAFHYSGTYTDQEESYRVHGRWTEHTGAIFTVFRRGWANNEYWNCREKNIHANSTHRDFHRHRFQDNITLYTFPACQLLV